MANGLSMYFISFLTTILPEFSKIYFAAFSIYANISFISHNNGSQVPQYETLWSSVVCFLPSQLVLAQLLKTQWNSVINKSLLLKSSPSNFLLLYSFSKTPPMVPLVFLFLSDRGICGCGEVKEGMGQKEETIT